jgi:hypothetical protein
MPDVQSVATTSEQSNSKQVAVRLRGERGSEQVRIYAENADLNNWNITVQYLTKNFQNMNVTSGQSNVYVTVAFINDMIDPLNGYDRNVFFDGIMKINDGYYSVPGCRISYSGSKTTKASEYQKGSLNWGGKYVIDIGTENRCGAITKIGADLTFDPPNLSVSVDRWLAKSVTGSTGVQQIKYKFGCSSSASILPNEFTSEFTISTDGDKRYPLVKVEAMYTYTICPVGKQLWVQSGSTNITSRLTNEDGSLLSLGNEKIIKFWDIPADVSVANITPDFKIDLITNSSIQGNLSSISQSTTLSVSCNFNASGTTSNFMYTIQAQTIPALSITNNNALPCSYGNLKGTLQITSNPALPKMCKIPSTGSTLVQFNPSTDTQLYFGTC